MITHQSGQVLKKLLFEHDIDEATLAKETGVSKSNISRLKNDPQSNPTLATLKPIADFFNISVSQLLGEVELTSNTSATKSMIPVLGWTEILPWLNNKATSPAVLSIDKPLSNMAFAVAVVDKTLGALFAPGAVIVCDNQSTYQDGQFVIVKSQAHEAPYLRQLLFQGQRKVLRSVRSQEHELEELNDATELLAYVVEVRYQV